MANKELYSVAVYTNTKTLIRGAVIADSEDAAKQKFVDVLLNKHGTDFSDTSRFYVTAFVVSGGVITTGN